MKDMTFADRIAHEGVVPVKRALISVWEKTGLEELAAALAKTGCEIVSTGGTRTYLEKRGYSVIELGQLTGHGEHFGGRVKTLSFEVAAGILFDREKDGDEARQLGLAGIDMVVCNLYPFKDFSGPENDLDDVIEHIDIGGVTLLRAAAKNAAWVTVIARAEDYAPVAQEISLTGGVGPETRYRLMGEVFRVTADYDSLISMAIDKRRGLDTLRLSFSGGQTLRYGENSHQSAKLYRQEDVPFSLADMKILGGKELSYNNMLDLSAAIAAVRDLSSLDGCACAVVKHTNPCGLAVAKTPREALSLAWDGDPVSAFGSIIAFTRPVDGSDLEYLNLDSSDRNGRKFVEIVAAPAFSASAVEYLASRKNIRIIETPVLGYQETNYRLFDGVLLAQSPDSALFDTLEAKTSAKISRPSDALARFGVASMKAVQSNAITVVRETADGSLQMVGSGGGQPNRLVPTVLALQKARGVLEASGLSGDAVTAEMGKCLLCSDAFFPFPDSIDVCAKEGILSILEPGGSMNDPAVIERAEEKGIALYFTEIRHFRH